MIFVGRTEEIDVIGDSPWSEQGVRYDFVQGQWAPLSQIGAPAASGTKTAAAWNGNDILAFTNGCTGAPDDCVQHARYEVARNRWRPLSKEGAPSSPDLTVPLIIDGADVILFSREGVETVVFRYVGLLNEWRREGGLLHDLEGSPQVSPTRPFKARHLSGFAAILAGRDVITFGGDYCHLFEAQFASNCIPSADPESGFAYNLDSRKWRRLSTTNAPVQDGYPGVSYLAWTGSQVLVWNNRPFLSPPTTEGGRYDPATDTWLPMNMTGAPPGRRQKAARSFSSGALIVWGGYDDTDGQVFWNDGAMYHSSLDRWVPMRSSGAPSGRFEAMTADVDGRMMIWGGRGCDVCATGALFDPVSNTWSAMAPAQGGSPSPRQSATAAGGNDNILLIGGGSSSAYPPAKGGIYDIASESWHRFAVSEPDQLVLNASENVKAGWMGDRFGLLVFNPSYSSPRVATLAPGEPTLIMEVIPGEPGSRSEPAFIITPSHMIVWGGYSPEMGLSASGFRRTADSSSWLPMAASPMVGRTAPLGIALTDGRALIIGGQGMLDGAIYDPVLDYWTALSGSGSVDGLDVQAQAYAKYAASASHVVFMAPDSAGQNQVAVYSLSTQEWRLIDDAFLRQALGDGLPGNEIAILPLSTGRFMFYGFRPNEGESSQFVIELDPVSGEATPRSTIGAPRGLSFVATTDVDGRAFVWGGSRPGSTNPEDSGALYCPAFEQIANESDVAATVSVRPSTTVPGDSFALTVRAANNGEVFAVGTKISVQLPPDLAFTRLDFDGGGKCSTPEPLATGSIICDMGSLPPFESHHIQVRLSALTTGSYVIPIEVAGVLSDPDPTNNGTSATVTVGFALGADLAVRDAAIAPYQVGLGGVAFLNTVVESKSGSGEGVELQIAAPHLIEIVQVGAEGGSCVTESTASATCQWQSLEPGSQRLVTAALRASAPGGSTVRLEVTHEMADAQPVDNVASAQALIDESDADVSESSLCPDPLQTNCDLIFRGGFEQSQIGR